MLQRLIAFSLRQRLMVLLAVLVLAGFGLRAYLQLPIDAYPDISPTQVKLILKAPGMTPEEVESRVVAPLEMELLGVPDAVMLRSTAKYAIADITLDFKEGTDIYWARQQVAERYGNVVDVLPAGVGGGLAPIATPLSDVLMFTIEAAAWTCRKSAPCSTGPSARPCARSPAWPTSTCWAATRAPSWWCRTVPACWPTACTWTTWCRRWSATTATTVPAACWPARTR